MKYEFNIDTFFVDTIARDVYGDIRKLYSSDDPLVERELDSIFSRRGKMVRPLFLMLAGQLVGGTWDCLRKTAMVIEAVHVASLIHDDVVDGSHIRRGQKTLNARFADTTSVLFGDLVFLKALNRATAIPHARAIPIIFNAVERMIEGEIREDLVAGYVDEKSYLSIASDKTASLFAASGELGILLSGGSEQDAVLGRELGECVGIAFQIIDDTLDFVGDEELMGKPRLADIGAERFTLPVIHAFREESDDLKNRLFAPGSMTADEIVRFVDERGGIDYAYGRAHEYADRAREILKHFGNPDVADIINMFFDELVTRVC